MCSLPNMTRSDFAKLSRSRKEKFKNNNVKTDEWVALDWICVDCPTNKIGE
jgi:hypothetical protein